jgi:hypothetical protein
MHLGIHHGLESKAVGSREVWAKSWDSRQKNLEAGIGNVPRWSSKWTMEKKRYNPWTQRENIKKLGGPKQNDPGKK